MANFTFIDEENLQEEEEFSLTDVFKSAMSASLFDVHTAIPAKVLKYYKDDQSVDCLPVLKKKFPDGEVREMPKIPKVPVAHQRTASAIIHMPIQKDDYVLLVFTERSIDKWIQSGGVIDPEDTRKHHLSDAVAIAGIFPFTQAADVNNDEDIIIKNTREGKKTEIRVKQNGKLQVINQTDEMIKLIYNFIKAITSGQAVVYTSTGPQSIKHFDFPEIERRLETFVEKKG